MKSHLLINSVIGVIIAIVAFLLVDSAAIDANLALALGVLVGSIIVPALPTLINQTSGSSDSSDGGTATLYVGNLPYRANEQAVREYFEQQGTVVSVRLMKDRRTGKRKGYGFVEMASGDANRAIKKLNDVEFQERTLKVREAKEKAHEDS